MKFECLELAGSGCYCVSRAKVVCTSESISVAFTFCFFGDNWEFLRTERAIPVYQFNCMRLVWYSRAAITARLHRTINGSYFIRGLCSQLSAQHSWQCLRENIAPLWWINTMDKLGQKCAKVRESDLLRHLFDSKGWFVLWKCVSNNTG